MPTDNPEWTGPNKIPQETFQFSGQLCSSSYSCLDTDAFFERVKGWMGDTFKNVCDADIGMDEVEKAMACLSWDKPPGSDLQRHFWGYIKDLFSYKLIE